jgi:hypothetical protein
MTVRRLFALALIALPALAPLAHAQSTAINGTIEGVVKDATGAVLPGVTIQVTNLDTGAQRSVTTGVDGGYRALLLPLGTYTVRAGIQGFKAAERTGVKLSAGQTATIDFTLEVGGMEEVVSVSGEAPIAEPGRIDLGRTISEAEIKNLPLVSRNPYNFAFLQANVTGYENEEFGVPRINANGSQMHTNYQIDGNTNTEKDRAGLRLLPVSEVVVKEVKVVTSGFAPEFGQTTGMVYNAVTPSGANQLSGSASFRLRRKGFSEKPFFLPATAPKPDTHVNNWTATLGGPIQKDRTHFYVGYEFVDRDLSADRVITVTPANAERLGLGSAAIPSSGVIPAAQTVNFMLAKIDHQLSASSKLSGRYFFFKNSSPFNVAGGLNTVERATDFFDRMDSASVQLISSIGSDRLNELRLQFARRHQFRTASDGSGTGPAINVSGAAQFGGPIAAAGDAGFDFSQKIWQVLDNFSWIRGRHNFKVGVDAQLIDDARVNALFQLYTFPSVDAYVAARSGVNPRSYTTFNQLFGDPTVGYNSSFFGVFAQDDFKISQSFKVLYGIRYDYFMPPDSRPFAGNPMSSRFKVDKNNLAPRVGFSWAIGNDARTVLRASSGLMYEPPLLQMYEDAIQRNGDPRTVSLSLSPTSAGAPAFPATLADLPAGFTLPLQSIVTVDPDFSTQYAVLTNVQLERALTRDLSMSVGYVSSIGRNMPVLVDTNLIPTGATLGDGRPIYATAVSAATRVNTAFNHIDVFQSIGAGSYNAFTAQVNKRMSHGFQFQASYTLARGKDNAPLSGPTGSPAYAVVAMDRVSDPSDIDRDDGVTFFNQTHTFVLSTLLQPRIEGSGLGALLANDNQLGFILYANSGLPFNIISNQDLNRDGLNNDRPLGIERNSGRLGSVVNVDARYVRFITLSGRVRAELFAEAKNLLNRGCSDPSAYATCDANVLAVNRIVTTDAAGNPAATLPSPFPGTQGYLQRAFQLGLKLAF